jgi:hypothetical protein
MLEICFPHVASGDPLYLCSPPSLFRIDLVAELAFWPRNGLHDKFHAARLACSVFSVAVLSGGPTSSRRRQIDVGRRSTCFEIASFRRRT